jgi:hypothetical protein
MYSSECRNWCPVGKPVQTLPIYRGLKIVMCQLPPGNPNLLPILVEKGCSWIGEQVVLLMTEKKAILAL